MPFTTPATGYQLTGRFETADSAKKPKTTLLDEEKKIKKKRDSRR